jgi:hypothetical protein
MIELDTKPVHDSSAPGWWIELEEAAFYVWAPRDSRPQWMACWEMWTNDPTDPDGVVDGSEISKCLRGDSAREVLTVLDSCPNPDLATRARRLLLGASEAHRTEPDQKEANA